MELPFIKALVENLAPTPERVAVALAESIAQLDKQLAKILITQANIEDLMRETLGQDREEDEELFTNYVVLSAKIGRAKRHREAAMAGLQKIRNNL